jgi:hypothetical protein
MRRRLSFVALTVNQRQHLKRDCIFWVPLCIQLCLDGAGVQLYETWRKIRLLRYFGMGRHKSNLYSVFRTSFPGSTDLNRQPHEQTVTTEESAEKKTAPGVGFPTPAPRHIAVMLTSIDASPVLLFGSNVKLWMKHV